MSRQSVLLAALIILSASESRSQYYFYNDRYYNTPVLVEAGISTGGFNCLTDLGGNKGPGRRFLKDVNLQNTHPGGGAYLVILFQQVAGIRFEGSIGQVSASDHILKNDESTAKNRFNRNLSFQTILREFSITAEFYPLSLLIGEDYPLFSPYITLGIGVFSFNPRANYQGKWVDLRPLHTEGQGFKEYPDRPVYRLTQINFPFGFGLRYEISAIFSARAEVVYRFLTTDYLDDVSTTYINPTHFQSNLKAEAIATAVSLADRSVELSPGSINQAGGIRGNPGNKDAYFSFNIKLGVVLNRKHR